MVASEAAALLTDYDRRVRHFEVATTEGLSFGEFLVRRTAQLSSFRGVSRGMRLRLLIYALASLMLLAFHAPVRAIVSLFSDFREL